MEVDYEIVENHPSAVSSTAKRLANGSQSDGIVLSFRTVKLYGFVEGNYYAEPNVPLYAGSCGSLWKSNRFNLPNSWSGQRYRKSQAADAYHCPYYIR
ncbi:hypothetical protein BaRGS_00012859 [Batillaria attramentaria]|uniref:Uncharacterized protein n=1 Tax=Batillaria attramentaria TaxID=370345 RepID=A0ABD0L8I2_9CAEN